MSHSATALKEHLRKVRSHIDLLSKKDYASKLSSLGQVMDGVVLFIPVERLSMALERDWPWSTPWQEHHPHLPNKPAGNPEGTGDVHSASR